MTLPALIHTNSVEATESLGRELARCLISDDSMPRFVAMYGDLGVGKTAFVRGFCSELCEGSIVRSPTFALVNDYKCKKNTGRIKHVYHFDMYRITGEDDLYSVGFYDYLDSGELCIAEWCELIPYALPDEYIEVRISKLNDGNDREIKIDINI